MTKLTVKDLLDLKGKQQLKQVFCHYPEEAKACQEAGVEMAVTISGDVLRQVRAAAPQLFITAGLPYGEISSPEQAIRDGFQILRGGADAVYTCHSTHFIEAMAREGIPVVGHVGLVPGKSTWFGGFKAVGKTCDQALAVYRSALAHQEAGAIAVEMEVVPERIAREISKRLQILVISLGCGALDVQYLYACDILGTRRNRVPRHSKTYADLFTDMQRLQDLRVQAFKAFSADVDNGGFPAADKLVSVSDREFEAFMTAIDRE